MKTFKSFITESARRVSVSYAQEHFPFITDLHKEEDLYRLMIIKNKDDIQSVEFLAFWYDDHEECQGVKINGVQWGWWWGGEPYRDILNRYFAAKTPNEIFLAKNEIYDIILNEKQRLFDGAEEDRGLDELLKRVENKIEILDKMKPETKKHFGDIIGGL